MPLDIRTPEADNLYWSSEGQYILALARNGVLASGLTTSVVGGGVARAVGGVVGSAIGAVTDALGGDDFVIITPPPNSYDDMTEAATNIQPTQGPIFYVEGLGMQAKVITIAGDSSVMGKPSPLDKTGAPPDLLRSTGAVQSGFSLFHKIERLIQKYHMETAQADVAGKIEMHFFNLKDGEFYIVEPLQFRKSRSAGKPLRYMYNLTMRVLGSSKFGGDVAGIAQVFEIVNIALFYERTATVSFSLGAMYQDVVNVLGAVGSEIVENIVRLERDLGRVLEVTNAVYDTGPTRSMGTISALEAVRRFVETGRTSQPRAAGSREEALSFIPTPAKVAALAEARSVTIADSVAKEYLALQRTSTVPRVDILDPTLDVYGAGLETRMATHLMIDGAPVQDEDLSEGPFRLIRTIHTVARRGEGSLPEGTTQRLTSVNLARTQNRGASGDLPTGGAGLAAIGRWPDLVEQAVPATFEAFRKRLGVADPRTYTGLYRRTPTDKSKGMLHFSEGALGGWRRWIETAALNKIHYPYFTDDGRSGTAKFGESILVPTADGVLTKEQLARLGAAQKKLNRLSLQDIYLGIDVAVDAATGRQVYDSRGELVLIAGAQAFAQNLRNRLSTTIGTFLPNTNYGLGVRVGGKASPIQIAVWRAMLVLSMRADARVLEVLSANVTAEQDTVQYKARVILRDVDEQIVVSGSLQS